MFKTLETFQKLEECTSGCLDGSSKQQFRHLRYKIPVKTPVTLESVLARINKISRQSNSWSLSLQTKILHNTDVLEIEQEDKMPRPCRHTSNHVIFHTPRCAVTADVPTTLPLQSPRANNPVRLRAEVKDGSNTSRHFQPRRFSNSKGF